MLATLSFVDMYVANVFDTRYSHMSLLESSQRPGWSNSMQKQNQVTEERSNTALEYVLEHAVPLQQVFKVEGHKKINLFFYYYYYL